MHGAIVAARHRIPRGSERHTHHGVQFTLITKRSALGSKTGACNSPELHQLIANGDQFIRFDRIPLAR